MHAHVCISRQKLGIQDFPLSSKALRLKVIPRGSGWQHPSCYSAWTQESRSCSQEPSTLPRFALQMLRPALAGCAHKSHTCRSWAQGRRINPCNSSGRISWASWSRAAVAVAATARASSQRELGGCLERAGALLMLNRSCRAANRKEEALRGGTKCQRWDYANQANASQRSEAWTKNYQPEGRNLNDEKFKVWNANGCLKALI